MFQSFFVPKMRKHKIDFPCLQMEAVELNKSYNINKDLSCFRPSSMIMPIQKKKNQNLTLTMLN